MTPNAGPPAGGASIARNLAGDYQRLMAALATRAARLGSRDPEAAAQETLRRSLENPKSHRAVDYYFADAAPAGEAPAWPLDQLLAWLHGVLLFVVREEQNRAAFRREISTETVGDLVDASAGPLEELVDRETRAIVEDCFRRLDPEYRDVLAMRIDGLKYSEIARRLRVNENTVATWVSRGIRELGARIRKRTGGSQG
ncbi:MAG TPA: sigma-70 family RNA polymerase sigma factor [Bryobacteraceae bacterium]|nr:sigma-70 family RNA polymerase sigma factor [Bryobacteraceae bacterium]